VRNYVQSADVASLTVNISKLSKEIHVLNFHRQKQAKTHVNRLKQSWNPKEIPGRGGDEKFMLCPLTSFSFDATASIGLRITA